MFKGFIKKLDQLIIKHYVPPFLMAFAIAAFVLLMLMLWQYIDEISGKGLGPILILELLFYKSISIIPQALPLGMLIASVMTMGNLGEHHELSSMSSAGISLWRLMRPLFFFGLGIALFSIYCSNTLIPISNLRFGSRMYDIQKTKPTLQMAAGTFNYDIDGYAIHFKEKAKNGREIKEVLIYDHSDDQNKEVLQIIAERGIMQSSPDGNFLAIKLENGYQYVEQGGKGNKSTYPFVRIKFDIWQKLFDLGNFKLTRSNPTLFSKSRQTMTSKQLLAAIDSISLNIHKKIIDNSNYASSYFHYQAFDSTYMERSKTEQNIISGRSTTKNKDSEQESSKLKGKVIPQKIKAPLPGYNSLLQTFDNTTHHNLKQKTKATMYSMLSKFEANNRSIKSLQLSKIKHLYDLHMKYCLAVVCLIFVLVGAPMGAIVRKGGFGLPVLISIIIFVLYVILMAMCKKFAESFYLSPILAAWLPVMVLATIGLLLSLKANGAFQRIASMRFIKVV